MAPPTRVCQPRWARCALPAALAVGLLAVGLVVVAPVVVAPALVGAAAWAQGIDEVDARAGGSLGDTGASRGEKGPPAAKIKGFAFEGLVRDPRSLRSLLISHVGEPATPERLEAVVRALEGEPRLGGLDLSLRRAPNGTVEVVVRVEKLRRYVDTLQVLIDGDADAGEGLLARLAHDGAGPTLETGALWHPYLGRRAQEALVAHYRDRGHLDAAAELKVEAEGELVVLRFEVKRGPQPFVLSVEVTGLPEALDSAPALVRVPVGAPLNPDRLARAVDELTADLCALGHPHATVRPRFVREGEGVRVRLTVDPGPERRIVALTVQGDPLPRSLRAPIDRGRPYCPATLDLMAERTRRWLKGRGAADPAVRWLARPVRKGVRITFELDGKARGPVHRIWFEGNTVTQERILRQLLAVREGDVPTADAIERSVENLRRSGLVRRAEARLGQSRDGAGYYLWIRVREWEFLSVDTRTRRFTLNNLNLYRWPDRFDERGLRGAGQNASVRTDTNDLELTFDDPFLLPHGSGGVRFARSGRRYDFLSESIDSVRLSFGARAQQNRLLVLPSLELSQTSRNAPSTYDGLRLRRDSDPELALGVRTALNYSRLDEERINYLGIDLGLDLLGSLYTRPDAGFFRSDLTAAFYLPVYAFENGQHLVARLAIEGHWLAATERTYAHQRVNLAVRGYGGAALRVPYALPDGTDARLGGRAGYLATFDLRIPLPLRRHALIPFGEVGTVGAAIDHRPWERLFPAAGLRYAFSLFGERLEGYVEGAWGFRDDAPTDLFGVGGGGSF